MDWSYRLLTPRQRDLFARLAVFAGQVEWTRSSRSVVTATTTALSSTLADLVDRSLVTVHVGNPTTYGMLETLRAFGRGQLPEPIMDALKGQHSGWALTLAEDTHAAEVTPNQGSPRRRFDAHLADIRHAPTRS